MRIRAFISAVVFGIILTVSANAATKCVALNASSTCTGTPTSGKVDWTATCNGIPITGVGVCSSTAGTAGDTADTLSTSTATDGSKYCWCKMTSPALSRFVFVVTMPSTALCSRNCAYNCVNYAVSSAAVRAGMFSNLK